MDQPATWITGLSTVLGAGVGGAVAYLTTRQQLRHASAEAELARDLALKCDVYLEAMDGLARGVELLASFGRVELTLQQLSEVPRGNAGWGFKIHAVAELPTVKAFNAAGEFLATRSLQLVEDRAKFDALKSEADTVDQEVESLNSQAQQLVQALQFVSAANAVAEARALAPQIASNLLTVQQRTVETQRRHDGLLARQAALHRRLVVKSMEAATEYQQSLADVTVNVRRELNLPIDADAYKKDMEGVGNRILAQLQGILDRFDAER